MISGRISDFLRSKGAKWRWSYLSIRTFLDLVPSLFVISGLGWFVGNGGEEFVDNDSDDVVFVMESLIFLGLCNLQLEYELPFLGNQYGLRGGRIRNSFWGVSLEYITEERNWYILYLAMYKFCFFGRLVGGGIEGELMLGNVIFDYLFQYILIVVWWFIHSIWIKCGC